jgi:hypothetical protein
MSFLKRWSFGIFSDFMLGISFDTLFCDLFLYFEIPGDLMREILSGLTLLNT